jgi:murein DD-endopeptidase MepM/ murein hydrolase activator NlpD
MSTRFKNILSILFVTLFLLGSVLSASAAAPEAVAPKESSLVLQQAARPEYLFPCNINLAGNWATVRGTTRTNAQLLQAINDVGRLGHDPSGSTRYAIDFNTNTSWKGPRAWGVCQNLDVLAARTGTVARVDSDCGAVWLRHPDGQHSFYLHMTKTSIQNVKVGNTYQAGQKIGTMGATAHAGKCSATGVHLHFAVTSNTNYISNELGLDKWVFTLPGGISGDTTFVKGNSELTINSEAVNLKVCADNLNGKPVYWQMWRNTVGSYPERVWNGSGVASGSCITFSDLDGAGPVFKDVTYYTVASLNPIAAGQAKLQRTACYTATGGKQLCDAIAFKDVATPPPATPETPTPTPPSTETPVPPPAQPQASMQWASPSIEKGQSITTDISFDPQGQPVKGLEYVCTTDNARLQYKNATVASAFGNNPVFAPIAQSDGSLIFPVAGSNGQVMSSSGIVGSLTFETIGAGQVSLDCTVRRLTTADELQQVPFRAEVLNIMGTETFPPPTETPPTEVPPTEVPPTEVPPTEVPPVTNLTLSGQLTLLNKDYSSAKITVQNAAGEEVASVTPDADGNFQVTLPAGEYTFIASATGFLSAQRSENITGDITLPSVTLVAGDINQDGKIDALDVVSLANMYNKSPLTNPIADLTGDGVVDLRDLVALAANYLKNGPLDW